MNRKAIFAALFLAIMAMSVIYASPAAAAATTQSSPTQERASDPTLTIPSSLSYDVNGTLIAAINGSGHAIITSTIPGFSSYNLTVKQLFVGVRLSAEASDITMNTTTGNITHASAYITVNARLVIKVDINMNGTKEIKDSYDLRANVSWLANWIIPYGGSKNFSVPFFSTEGLDPTNVGSTANATPVKIQFTNDNGTWESSQFSIDHVQWDFSNWLKTRIQDGLDSIWGKVTSNLQSYNIPGIQGGFVVDDCVGKVDLWKTSGTQPNNILLMADALIYLRIDFSVAGNGSISFKIGSTSYTITYNIDFSAKFTLYFSLVITSDWSQVVTQTNYTYNNFTILVPENATLVRRKVGVIFYYNTGSSTASGIDVTGGKSWGNKTLDGQVLFFVDYGWTGVPDFATNGTGQPATISNDTSTVSGTGYTRSVTIYSKSAGSWIYFNLDVTGYTVKSITRSDGTTLNVTQYWAYNDSLGNKMLYVCDDPAYSYTVQFVGSSGPSMTILLGAAVIVVIAMLGVVVYLRRRSGSSGVSVKAV